MRHGIDRASAITPADLTRLQSEGWNLDFMAVYIGGPRSAGSGWTRDGIQALQSLLDDSTARFLPVYVGRNEPWDAPQAFSDSQGATDAADAYGLLTSYGFQDGPICLDVEAGTYDSHPGPTLEYIRGFCVTMREQYHVPVGIYSPPRAIQAAREWKLIDFGWAAFWYTTGDSWYRLVKQFPDISTMDQDGLTSGPPEIWQFVGDVPLIGGIDLNVASDTFTFARSVIPASAATPAQPVQPPQPEAPAEPAGYAPNVPPSAETAQEIQTVEQDASQLPAPVTSPEAEPTEVAARVAKVEADLGKLIEHLGLGEVFNPPAAAAPTPLGSYTVQLGDSLSKIANKLGYEGQWQALAAENPAISDPSMIHPGDVLKLPEGW